MVKIRSHLITNRILMVLVVCSTMGYILYDRFFSNNDNFLDSPMEINILRKYRVDPVGGVHIITFKAVEITAYNNTPDQTDSSPNRTATGNMVAEGMIAISQDYFRKTIYPGDLVYIKKIKKWFVADDCKNARFSHSFDIFMFDVKQAHKFGKITSDVYVIRMEK